VTPAFQEEHVKGFFAYAKERQTMLLKRQEGKLPPWTDDPILGQFRFCNIFREDDTVTRWIRENIREPYADKKGDLVFALCAARLFNLPSTLQRLTDKGLLLNWNKAKVKKAVAGLEPVVNAAYIVIGRANMPKGEGIIECLDVIHKFRHDLYKDIKKWSSIEATVELLSDFERMGPFLAYEIATDLRHTEVLSDANDIDTWANPGPGAARGLSRMIGEHKKFFKRQGKADRVVMIELMQELLKLSRKRQYWPGNWQRWEMRDVEHTLCEYDKYLRAKTGEGRPKQLYRPE